MKTINEKYTGSGGVFFDRQITPEQYKRGVENRGYLTKDDEKTVLTDSERLGYGASCTKVFEQDGEFYVHCHRWNHCD